MNDLLFALEHTTQQPGNTMCYADDLLVICDDKDTVNKVAMQTDQWAKDNRIKINYKKDKTARL